MKKYFVFAILTVFSLVLSACVGSGVAHQDLPPTDPNYVAGQNVAVDNTLTYTQEYDACVNNVPNISPMSVDTDLFGEDALIWQCGKGELDNLDMVLVPTMSVSRLTPGNGDNAIVYALVMIKNTAYVLVAAAAGNAIGESLAYQHHTSKQNSPTINGSRARDIISKLLEVVSKAKPGDMPPFKNCGTLSDDATGAILKVAYLFYDSVTNGDAIAWYWAKTGGTPWGGAYPKNDSGKGTFEDGPSDRKPGQTWTTGMDLCQKYGNLPRLQPAQP